METSSQVDLLSSHTGMTTTMEFAESEENYYSLLLNYLTSESLPEDLSEIRRAMIIHRSRHYQVIDGQLHYGRKLPKKVILDNATRHSLMQNIHINKDTGVHLGVQKMHLYLKKDYFWRGMYIELAKFVRECKKCFDADLPLASVKMLAHKHKRRKSCKESDNESTESKESVSATLTDVRQNEARIWTKVELRLSGPYNDGKFILSIADPGTSWLDAVIVEPPNLAIQAANYLFSTFCQFGFAHFTTVGFSLDLLTCLQLKYKEMVHDLISKSSDGSQLIKLTDYTEQKILCPWVEEVFVTLVTQYPETWQSQVSAFLFDYRCMHKTSGLHSPFMRMFQRNPLPSLLEENKENTRLRFSKRLQNSQTKVSNNITESSMTHVAFRKKCKRRKRRVVRQTKVFSNSEDEDEPDELVGEAVPAVPQETPSTSTIPEDNPEVCEARASTVSAVQAILSATKEERSRRGQYQRYSAELRDQMAAYAIKHGSLAAAKHFTEKLGTQISESTIRNFARNYQTFSPDIQEQIGAFAMTNGVELASQHFTEQLGFEVRPNTVRKFKKLYAAKYPTEKNCSNIIAGQEPKGNKKKTFDSKLKYEIGLFACQYGVEFAVEHFSNSLDTPIKDLTVKKFKKLFEEKQKESAANNLTIQPIQNGQHTLQSETMDVVQASFNVLNCSPASQTLVYNQQPSYQQLVSPVPYSSTSSIDQSIAYQQQSVASVISANPTLVFSQTSFQPPTSYASTFTQLSTTPHIHLSATTNETQLLSAEPSEQCSTSQMIISQHPIIITQSSQTNVHDGNLTMHMDNITNLSTFETQISSQRETSAINFLQPSTISYAPPIASAEVLQQNQQEANVSSTNFNSITVIDSSSQVMRLVNVGCESTPEDRSIQEPVSNITEQSSTNRQEPTNVTNDSLTCKISKSKVKCTEKCKSTMKKSQKAHCRGNYTTYSPEIRAEIGRYAETHGNQQAILHFRDILGYDLPESTVRGLKAKYRAKKQLFSDGGKGKNSKAITSLGFAPRGRPMRLGKYDEVVRKCIRDLVSNGERVSSFLAIATAKQVLLEHEPSLLVENGGNIKLTANWAKSFLKRIGIHNNS